MTTWEYALSCRTMFVSCLESLFLMLACEHFKVSGFNLVLMSFEICVPSNITKDGRRTRVEFEMFGIYLTGNVLHPNPV